MKLSNKFAALSQMNSDAFLHLLFAAIFENIALFVAENAEICSNMEMKTSSKAAKRKRKRK